MRKRFGMCCLLMWGLVAVTLADGVIGGVSSAQAQGTGTQDGRAQAEAAAKMWAEELLGSFPDYVEALSTEEKRITFHALSSGVLSGGRQRDEVYQIMLKVLGEVGKSDSYTVQNTMQSDRVMQREWEERRATAQHKGYRGTRIILSCPEGVLGQQITLVCTAQDTTTHKQIGKDTSVKFDRQWLYKPLDLDVAVESVAKQLVKGLRGELGQVNVENRKNKETDLTKYISDTLRVHIRTKLPRDAAGEPHEVKGKIIILGGEVRLLAGLYGRDGGLADAAFEYVTMASVKKFLRPHKVGESFRDCQECPEMVVIPAGTYRMGSPEAEGGRGRSEGPLHDVRIQEKLAVGRYEVTRGEYGDFVKETGRETRRGCWVGDGGIKNWRQDGSRSWQSPGFGQGEGHPVVCVSWEDARAYADWLSDKTGETYRLLSEAEWEYATRAGTRTSRYWGDSETGQCRHANGADAAFGAAYGSRPPRSLSCRDGSAHTAEVGRHGANAWGLSDMLGNVWEWVEDCWHENYKGAPEDGSAWVPEGRCEARAVRGGSWYYWSLVRSAARGSDRPVNRNFDTGFRVARTLAR